MDEDAKWTDMEVRRKRARQVVTHVCSSMHVCACWHAASGPGLHVVDQVVRLLASLTCVSGFSEEDEAGEGGQDEGSDGDEVRPVKVIEAGI